MFEFLDSLVGPINSNWCYYFYFLSLISLLVSVSFGLRLLLSFFMKRVKFNVLNLHMFIHFFIIYFVNRIMFNICIRTL